ncbi:unnamed protein product [Polarella glacialis]|uniref:Uncharacterized protein n=1 Tax=Polarella glacialis TaxID=89957 RepID=A0A813GEB6_POLGL|nr:unnamed protein product [Polarella glacialis]
MTGSEAFSHSLSPHASDADTEDDSSSEEEEEGDLASMRQSICLKACLTTLVLALSVTVWIGPGLAYRRALLDGCAEMTSESPWSFVLTATGSVWAAGISLLLLARGFRLRWLGVDAGPGYAIGTPGDEVGDSCGDNRALRHLSSYSWSLGFVPLPLIYMLASAYGVTSVLYLMFIGLVVRAFCIPLRLLQEMHTAGYISKETWAAAVSLGQLQIGGLLASTTSTVLSVGSIIFGSSLQVAMHDESGRDMFIFVHFPMWLDIIANSTCVLFLSGAVHMHNAVLGNALARQRNRVALLGSSKSVVDRKWHEKVSELAEQSFTLESLLSFYKRLGTDYMLHYKSDAGLQ